MTYSQEVLRFVAALYSDKWAADQLAAGLKSLVITNSGSASDQAALDMAIVQYERMMPRHLMRCANETANVQTVRDAIERKEQGDGL